MNFFKHFTDAHEGRSMVALMNEFGLEGYAAYFILMELCMEKLEKPVDREICENDCRFVFPERLLREKLRMRRSKLAEFLFYCRDERKLFHFIWTGRDGVEINVDKIRGSAAEHQLKLNRSVTKVELLRTNLSEELNFYVPKLLESLDRDSKRARHWRADGAPKNKNKEIDIRDENFEWPNAARLVSTMLKRHGDWSKNELEVKEALGHDLFNIAKLVGPHRMRSLPSNKFYYPALSGMLKGAFESIKLQEIS